MQNELKKSLTKRNSTTFKKGRVKTGGRKKGILNKRTMIAKVVRDNILALINGKIKICINESVLQKIYSDIIKLGLRNDDPWVRLSVALEIFQYLQKENIKPNSLMCACSK